MSGVHRRFARRRSARWALDRGAVAVEFALVLPLLAALLMGTVTAGLSYSESIGLTNAVREGARFGATAESGSTWGVDVIARTRALQFDDPGATPETVLCAQLRKVGDPTPVEGAGDCTGDLNGPTAPDGFAADDCFVWVAGSRPFEIVTILAPSLDKTMYRSSVARYEGSCP